MNTLNFLDANVWLALLWKRHIHSETALKWFDQASETVFLLPFYATHGFAPAYHRKDHEGRYEDDVRSVVALGSSLGRQPHFLSSGAAGNRKGFPSPFATLKPFAKGLG